MDSVRQEDHKHTSLQMRKSKKSELPGVDGCVSNCRWCTRVSDEERTQRALSVRIWLFFLSYPPFSFVCVVLIFQCRTFHSSFRNNKCKEPQKGKDFACDQLPNIPIRIQNQRPQPTDQMLSQPRYPLPTQTTTIQQQQQQIEGSASSVSTNEDIIVAQEVEAIPLRRTWLHCSPRQFLDVFCPDLGDICGRTLNTPHIQYSCDDISLLEVTFMLGKYSNVEVQADSIFICCQNALSDLEIIFPSDYDEESDDIRISDNAMDTTEQTNLNMQLGSQLQELHHQLARVGSSQNIFHFLFWWLRVMLCCIPLLEYLYANVTKLSPWYTECDSIFLDNVCTQIEIINTHCNTKLTKAQMVKRQTEYWEHLFYYIDSKFYDSFDLDAYTDEKDIEKILYWSRTLEIVITVFDLAWYKSMAGFFELLNTTGCYSNICQLHLVQKQVSFPDQEGEKKHEHEENGDGDGNDVGDDSDAPGGDGAGGDDGPDAEPKDDKSNAHGKEEDPTTYASFSFSSIIHLENSNNAKFKYIPSKEGTVYDHNPLDIHKVKAHINNILQKPDDEVLALNEKCSIHIKGKDIKTLLPGAWFAHYH